MGYSNHIHDKKGLSRNLRLYTNILWIEQLSFVCINNLKYIYETRLTEILDVRIREENHCVFSYWFIFIYIHQFIQISM